jgi:hypothetical protein
MIKVEYAPVLMAFLALAIFPALVLGPPVRLDCVMGTSLIKSHAWAIFWGANKFDAARL